MMQFSKLLIVLIFTAMFFAGVAGGKSIHNSRPNENIMVFSNEFYLNYTHNFANMNNIDKMNITNKNAKIIEFVNVVVIKPLAYSMGLIASYGLEVGFYNSWIPDILIRYASPAITGLYAIYIFRKQAFKFVLLLKNLKMYI